MDDDTTDRSIDGSTFKEQGGEKASSSTALTSVIDPEVEYDILKSPLGDSMLTDYAEPYISSFIRSRSIHSRPPSSARSYPPLVNIQFIILRIK